MGLMRIWCQKLTGAARGAKRLPGARKPFSDFAIKRVLSHLPKWGVLSRILQVPFDRAYPPRNSKSRYPTARARCRFGGSSRFQMPFFVLLTVNGSCDEGELGLARFLSQRLQF